MLKVKKEGIILERTKRAFENDAVLNPACMQEGDKVHMFYRAVKKGNNSTIGYCLLKGPLEVVKRAAKPILKPEHSFERESVEDPRIVNIEDTYYLTYTAYNYVFACGALALSKDLKKFKKYGYITPRFTYKKFFDLTAIHDKVNPKYYRLNDFNQPPLDKKMIVWDKDVVFFPRRINGNLVFLHRIKPEIQVVSVKDLKQLTKKFWEKYAVNFHGNIFMKPKYPHEAGYIGAGCPPIETEDGWLVIYHGVYDGIKGFIYNACAALFDSKDYTKEIGRLKEPLFAPSKSWEKEGSISNVVFPTGTSMFGDRLYIYYGAADSHIAAASVKLKELLSELKKKSNRH